jgi:hypothetical protein
MSAEVDFTASIACSIQDSALISMGEGGLVTRLYVVPSLYNIAGQSLLLNL